MSIWENHLAEVGGITNASQISYITLYMAIRPHFKEKVKKETSKTKTSTCNSAHTDFYWQICVLLHVILFYLHCSPVWKLNGITYLARNLYLSDARIVLYPREEVILPAHVFLSGLLDMAGWEHKCHLKQCREGQPYTHLTPFKGHNATMCDS